MLCERGHHFRTQSDTEVIVHLYEDEAGNTPKFLKEMFAFSIYDQYEAMAHELLDNREGIMQLFSPKAISETMRTGLGRQSDRADSSIFRAGHQLWALMQLAAWERRFKVSL